MYATEDGRAGQANGRAKSSTALIATLEPPALGALVAEVLERNPGVARARHRTAAAAARAPQVRALPDPVAELSLFLLPTETRVGAQQFRLSISQELPWFGKLPLRQQVALYAAAAAEAEIETLQLDLITETRRLFYELAFHHVHEALLHVERDTLVRYEEVARGRYAAGNGSQQAILRIQAEITRIDMRFLEISEHRAMLISAVNDLRDRPYDSEVEAHMLPTPTLPQLNVDELLRSTWRRPEIKAADARIAERKTLVRLAEKEFRPNFKLSLDWTSVERRDDTAARLSPPQGNGNDALSLSGSINLPVRRRKLEAGLAEALALQKAAEESRRLVLTDIEHTVGDLKSRLPLLYEHWNLLEKVLQVQTREALRSAETGYATGKLDAIDLLDSEVMLLNARTAAARTRTDYLIAWAQLERAIGHPLSGEDTP